MEYMTALEEAIIKSNKAISENPARAWDAYEAAQEAMYQRAKQSSTCADCDHCHIAPESQMEYLVRYMTNHVKHLYVKAPGVTRTDESLEYDISRACTNAVRLCAWCDENCEFIDADDDFSQECDEFIQC